METGSEQIDLFGLSVRNAKLDEATARIADRALAGERDRVFFLNAHCVNVAVRNGEYRRALRDVDVLYADGSGLALAAKVAGSPLIDNVNGTDMFPRLCKIAAERGVPIALLGARKEIVDQCAANMQAKNPGLEIAYKRDGFFTEEEEPGIINDINSSGAKILLVAMGVPMQELFIQRNYDRLGTPQVLAVGGLFDFYSGLRKRAPFLIRKLGLEWTVRLAQEPKRLFKRYILGNPQFIARTLRLRLRGRSVLREQMG